MVEKQRISVAMTTYNGERFLKEQLDSILMQLEPLDELVVSDDGSMDKTVSILEEYQKKDGRIRLIQGPGKGIKKNVEYVLKQCRGEIIFLADQDDIWQPEKRKEVLEIFKTHKVSLVIHDAMVFETDVSKPVMNSFLDFRNGKAGIVKNIMKNSYIGCCMAFRAELKEKILPIPSKIEMHDQWIGILSDFYGPKSCFYRKPLLFYRRHEENNSKMNHYGIGRMLRNRLVFVLYFGGRIMHIC